MINRTQLIFGSGIVIVVVIYIITVMGIIDNLKNEIKTLTATVTQQDNEIRLLNNNITALQKNISAITETVNITNDYILKIEKIQDINLVFYKLISIAYHMIEIYNLYFIKNLS